MTIEQLTAEVMEHAGEIRALQENTKSAHRRIDENNRITEGIHKLAVSVETLALQVKQLTDKVESSVARLENGQKNQGQRIGSIEATVSTLMRTDEKADENAKRLDTIEKEPAHKWKTLISQITGIVVTAIITAIIVKFTG